MSGTTTHNKHGWLRVTELLAGEVEQFAIQGDGTKHVVQLLHDRVRDDFIVSVTIEQDGTTSTAQHAFGRDVGQARRAFSGLARASRKEARK